MIKKFLDTGDVEEILKSKADGITTNPSLMRKAGVEDYEGFAKDIIANTDKPVSFEVFSDDFDEMERQAHKISSWGDNVYVKIPVTNTKGESSFNLIEGLVLEEVKVNVTAIMTVDQVSKIVPALNKDVPAIVSVFAGRIADTGLNPSNIMLTAKNLIDDKAELLWASPRQVFDVYLAENVGCDIITISPEIYAKLELKGKSLDEFSLDTVKMFYEDGKGYDIS